MIFEEYPLIILKENEKKITALEMFIKLDFNNFTKNNTFQLIKFIVQKFVIEIFDED